MENENKKKPFAPTQAKATPEALAFDSWFTMKVAEKRKVQAHHYDTLRAYFTKQGLSASEPTEQFDAALKAFGY